MEELIVIGDIAARTQLSVDAAKKRWERLGRYPLQKKMDDAWDAKIADDPYGHLERVLADIAKRHDRESLRGPLLLGDIGTGGSRAGLVEDFVYEEHKLLKQWLQQNFEDLLGDLMAVTGNHESVTLHPDTPLSECQVSQISFDRFEELWGPVFQTKKYGPRVAIQGAHTAGGSFQLLPPEWMVCLISSELLLIEDDAPDKLLCDRVEHIKKIRHDLEQGKDGKIILIFHHPEACRILADPKSVPGCEEDLTVIRDLLPKIKCTLIGHLEKEGAEKYFYLWRLVPFLTYTPLVMILWAIFKNKDRTKVLRKVAKGCARASKFLHLFKAFVVPSPKQGYYGLRFLDDNTMSVVRYPADKDFEPEVVNL